MIDLEAEKRKPRASCFNCEKSMSGKVHIGTSGWNYKHWKGVFYPEDLPQSQWLDYFKDCLNTVEINNTFYGAPSEKTFGKWRDTVDEDFTFSVKANRYITHMKKLKDPDESLESFEFYEVLKEKLKVILIQLPPNFKFNENRLTHFVKSLPSQFKYTMEFRDKSWINEKTEEILSDQNIAFCIYDLAGYESPGLITADFMYIRLHGPQKQKYKGKYSNEQLKSWAKRIKTRLDQGLNAFIYFDNDEQGFAVENAIELRGLMQSS